MHFRRSSFLAAMTALCGWMLFIASALAASPTDSDWSRLEQTAQGEMRATNTPGAAIGIVQDGQIAWSRGLGVANVETGQPVTPETLFRLGSTTKMFTAAALVMLAEEGKLKLDEPVGKCLSGLHPQIAALTPHQLLTHTAGLTDESIMSGRHDDAALGDNIRQMNASWLFTEPGKIHSYANPGYWIAGLACEELEHKPYADVMHERLFRPLGMTRTTLRPTLAMTWPLALGHEVRSGKPAIVRPQADNAATWPAGQMYSSVNDLARFATAFMDGGKLDGRQVLPPAVITKLSAPLVPRPGDDGHYGYGLSVSDERGVHILSHGGSRTGYGSTIRLAPEHKIAVIILTNRSSSSLPKTAAAALEIMLPFQPRVAERRAEPPPLSEQEMAQLVGVYSNHRQTIELTLQDGKLHARRRGATVEGASGSIVRTGEQRIAITGSGDDPAAGRPLASFFIVKGQDGQPEYLLAGSRALKRQPANPAGPVGR
jgi:CubicO group peptidase (beta-lactamase class C family)